MAFIEIFKNGEKRKVSKSAYENFFKDTGWIVAGENPALSISNMTQVEEKNNDIIKSMAEEEKLNQGHSDDSESISDEWDEVLSEEEDEVEEEIEKPISEMTRNELIEYAKKNDISLAGLSKTNQFREAIREATRGR